MMASRKLCLYQWCRGWGLSAYRIGFLVTQAIKNAGISEVYKCRETI